MFHSWMCKHPIHPQVLEKKNVVGHRFLSRTPAFTWVCAFEESAMASFLFSESQSIKGSRRVSLWEGAFLLLSPKNALSDLCSFNEKTATRILATEWVVNILAPEHELESEELFSNILNMMQLTVLHCLLFLYFLIGLFYILLVKCLYHT